MNDWIQRREKFILVIILLLAALVYSPSLFNDFTYWDDLAHTLLNEDIRKLDLDHLLKIFASYYVGMYHPLTTLTFAINYALGGYNPLIYHATNYLLHLVNSILVYFVVRRISNKPFIALFSTAIFALHPMHVESVAWIAERKDVLYAFFFFLSLLLYINYRERLEKRWYWFSLFAFLCSLLSKSAAVPLPLILVLIDWYCGDTEWKSRKALIEKVPYAFLALIFGVISLLSQHAGKHPYFHATFEWFDKPFLVTYAFSFYIIRYLLPLNLSAIHPFPTKVENYLPVEYYLSPLLVGAAVIFLFKEWKYVRTYRFGMLFYILMIVLVVQIIPLGYAIVTERYAYVPYIGISFIVGSLFEDVLQKRLLRYGAIVLLFTFFSFAAITTYNRTQVWKNTLTLFIDASRTCPTEYARSNMIAFAYKMEGEGRISLKQYQQAIDPLSTSIRYNNEISETYYARAIAYLNTNLLDSAIADFEQAINIDPNVPHYHRDLGTTYLRKKEYIKAIDHFTIALTLDSTNVALYNDRGIAYLRTQQYNHALCDFSTALRLDSSYARAYANRGIIYIHLKQSNAACGDFHRALEFGFKEVEPLIKQYCNE